MITTLTLYQPSYGPHGEPYSVRACFAGGVALAHYGTEAEALDARDAAFDQGAHSVHVAGLPLRLAVAGPTPVRPLPGVED